jgi:hypothetical protein
MLAFETNCVQSPVDFKASCGARHAVGFSARVARREEQNHGPDLQHVRDPGGR